MQPQASVAVLLDVDAVDFENRQQRVLCLLDKEHPRDPAARLF